MKRSSFVLNLGEVRSGVLRLDEALITVAQDLPLTDQRFARNIGAAGKLTETTDLNGALVSLGIFVVLSSFVFLRKMRPE